MVILPLGTVNGWLTLRRHDATLLAVIRNDPIRSGQLRTAAPVESLFLGTICDYLHEKQGGCLGPNVTLPSLPRMRRNLYARGLVPRTVRSPSRFVQSSSEKPVCSYVRH